MTKDYWGIVREIQKKMTHATFLWSEGLMRDAREQMTMIFGLIGALELEEELEFRESYPNIWEIMGIMPKRWEQPYVKRRLCGSVLFELVEELREGVPSDLIAECEKLLEEEIKERKRRLEKEV